MKTIKSINFLNFLNFLNQSQNPWVEPLHIGLGTERVKSIVTEINNTRTAALKDAHRKSVRSPC